MGWKYVVKGKTKFPAFPNPVNTETKLRNCDILKAFENKSRSTASHCRLLPVFKSWCNVSDRFLIAKRWTRNLIHISENAVTACIH